MKHKPTDDLEPTKPRRVERSAVVVDTRVPPERQIPYNADPQPMTLVGLASSQPPATSTHLERGEETPAPKPDETTMTVLDPDGEPHVVPVSSEIAQETMACRAANRAPKPLYGSYAEERAAKGGK